MRQGSLAGTSRWSTLLLLLLLAGCGGGGGGGGGGGNLPALTYSGNTSQATVTATNSSRLVSNVFGSSDTASIVMGGASVTRDSSTAQSSGGLIGVSRVLNRASRRALAGANRGAVSGVTINETEPCDGNIGSIRTTGTLNDSTLTGTLALTFTNCLLAGLTLNGTANVQVLASDPVACGGIPTDFITSFTRITIRGNGVSVDAGGSLRVQLSTFPGMETVTNNLIDLNNLTGVMTKSENLVSVGMTNNICNPTFVSNLTFNGRIFDSVHGFVDVSTRAPLVFSASSQLFPDGGQLLLTGSPIGAGNRSILVSALSSTMVWLELDLDGNGTREITAFLKWTDLSGPVGADLADSDGDGLHNSWEMANFGTNNAADAAADSDGDGYSNRKEYLGGGNPNNASVLPTLGKALLTVATGISTANSNQSNPGKSGLASDGAKYLLVSCSELGPSPGVFGVFVSGATAGEPFPIAPGDCGSLGGTSENSISQPNVAFNGTNYLVVFVKGAIIRGIRVSSSGTVLDGPDGFAISTGVLFSISSTSPAVASDGSNYLVTWSKFIPISGAGTRNVFGAIVTTTGQVSSEIPISVEQNTAPEQHGFALELGGPSLAFDGTNYLVVWNKVRTGPGTSIFSTLFAVYSDILGTRMTPQGVVLDPQGILFSTSGPLSQSPGAENVKVAFDGTNYLAVWRKALPTGFDPPQAEIRGTRISPSGTLLDGPPLGGGIGINTIALGKSEPAVAFDGTNYLVAWVVGAFQNSPPAGMFGAKVSPSGLVVEGGLPTATGISLSNQPPAFARFVFPVMNTNGTSVFLTWVNNIELFGQTKSLAGALIFP